MQIQRHLLSAGAILLEPLVRLSAARWSPARIALTVAWPCQTAADDYLCFFKRKNFYVSLSPLRTVEEAQ
jgi:hypothetical protein